MIDIGMAIRKAYYQALKDNVTWEGAVVPFVDEKLDVNINEQDIFVLFGQQTEETGNTSNKTYFANEVFLTMQIVNQRRATNTKEVVENIASQILNILFPSRTTWNLSIDAPLRLTYARYVSGQYNPLAQDTNGFVISKLLTFKNRITQN